MKLETDSLELGWGWHSNADVWAEFVTEKYITFRSCGLNWLLKGTV